MFLRGAFDEFDVGGSKLDHRCEKGCEVVYVGGTCCGCGDVSEERMLVEFGVRVVVEKAGGESLKGCGDVRESAVRNVAAMVGVRWDS